MTDISDLPMLQARSKIESGEYHQGEILPAADLAHEYNVSIRVTYSALAMLAANRYVSRLGAFTSYSVIWRAGT
jgi:DNA-binding FadR family transcriptional regulator